MLFRLVIWHLARFLVIVLAAGLMGATLVRLAPAFGVSDADLDPRLSGSVQANTVRPNVAQFYMGYVRGLTAGDFGISSGTGRPIAELLRERLPVSLRSLGVGVGVGAGAGFGSAAVVTAFSAPVVSAAPVVVSTVLLSIPSAALALLFVIAGWPPGVALAALLFPKIYRLSVAVLAKAASAPHIVAARARGVSAVRIFFAHIVAPACPQLLAIAGMAVSIGFPALVPVEAVCDSPGVLQLAWRAALARDLPVLVTMTMVASVIVLCGNAAADLSAKVLGRRA